MASPATYNLSIYQGDTFSLTLRLRDTNPDGSLGAYINLTGAEAKAEVRTPDDTIVAELTATVLDQTTTLGGVTLALTHTQTAALTPATNLVWDFQITDSAGVVTTYLRGTVEIVKEVTR